PNVIPRTPITFVPSVAGTASSGTAATLRVPLLVEPDLQVKAAVEHAAAQAEAARTGPEVTPVAERCDGGAEKLGCLGDGEQVGLCIDDGLGHGCLQGWTGVRRSPGEGAVSGPLVTAHSRARN